MDFGGKGNMERLTIEYCGEYMPKGLCSIDRQGGADDSYSHLIKNSFLVTFLSKKKYKTLTCVRVIVRI